MAQVYQFTSPATESPEMSLDYDGAEVWIEFYDGAGDPVVPSGRPLVYRKLGAGIERPVQQFTFDANEWQFNGPCDRIRIDVSGVTGYDSYRVFVWRTLRPIPLADPRLMTGSTNPRLRVDLAQTGFFEGREFRTFREFSIPAGQTLALEIVVPVNAILFEQGLELDQGSLRVTNAVGGTPGGVFAEALPIIGKNNMSERPIPLYAPTITFHAGGTHTGGFIFDVHRIVAASATAQQATVGRTVGDERGIAINTYYVRYENFGTGPATGTFWFIWEERP